MDILVSAILVIFILLAAFAVLLGRLFSSTRIRSFDPEALQRFSVETYRPMARLLSRDDVEFLRTQPGYEPGIERTLMKARRSVFRCYLRAMGQDFNRLHRALRLMVLHAPEDRSEIAVLLVRQKVRFFTALAFAHVRLTLHAVGIGAVDVSGLVTILDSMGLELRTLALARQPGS